MKTVSIIDYGSGNVRNLVRAFKKLDIDPQVTEDASAIKNSTLLVLPGVGNFDQAIRRLRRTGAFEAIGDALNYGVPLLGVCLGMHLLTEKSEESLDQSGFSRIAGQAARIEDSPSRRVPNVGWQSICWKDAGKALGRSEEEEESFYFAHSYHVTGQKEDIVAATTDIGIEIPAAIIHENIVALQFHPEISGKAGHQLLQSFLSYAESI